MHEISKGILSLCGSADLQNQILVPNCLEIGTNFVLSS